MKRRNVLKCLTMSLIRPVLAANEEGLTLPEIG